VGNAHPTNFLNPPSSILRPQSSILRPPSSTVIQLSLEQYRQQFPALANTTYFNYGGQGVLPQSALQALYHAYQTVEQMGPFSLATADWLGQETDQLRAAIATELAVAPETITLTENVSMGCNIALWGLDWQAGDHILLSDCEHYGIIAAVQELQQRFNIEISTFPLLASANGDDPTAILAQHLRPTTRLVVLSHILWNTGQVLPLDEMATACHRYTAGQYPVRLLIDAAQSVGVLPLNLAEMGVDFYAFTGHKWWCGPAGVGGLYVRPDALASLRPTFVGWRSVVLDGAGHPKAWKLDGNRFEIATSAYPLYSGLRAAIALHQQWQTPQERYQRICQLSQHLWQQLDALPSVTCLHAVPPDSGLVAFQLPGQSHSRLVQFLEQHGIQIRKLPNPDCVRACIHYFTLETEIEQLLEGIKQFTRLQG